MRETKEECLMRRLSDLEFMKVEEGRVRVWRRGLLGLEERFLGGAVGA